ncbi:MAG: T9SS type A sorting domain-containing protein [Bacteroidales bacterium]|nr:T9SS type A sorting domain-containing protein [Bacteroidales bacterium]
MKKSILTAAMLLMSISALQAQRDTLGFYVNYPWYFKNYPFENIRDTTHNGTSCIVAERNMAMAGENSLYSYTDIGIFHNWDRDIAFGFHSDTTIHVIGVAWAVATSHYQMYSDVIEEYEAILSHEHPEYDSVFCRLYIPDGNGMQRVREKGLEEIERSDFHLYHVLKDLPTDGSLNSVWHYSGNTAIGDAGIVEIFFDQEIDLSDTFYISVKNRNKLIVGGAMEDMAYGAFEAHNPVVDTFIYPTLSYRMLPDTASSVDAPWIYGVKRTYPLLFPIIRRDCDTCPQVQGIQVIPAGNGQAFLKWQRGTSHVDWQVSYGPAGTAPENGTKVDCTAPQSALIAFNPDSHYVAYVRARCRFARYEWGPWSDSLSIYLGAGGIDETMLASMVTLSPNPATDEVVIDSQLPISMIEAYDEKGACILRTELNAPHTSLNTNTWSSGTYLLRIHTPQGTAVKKLVVR